MSSLRRPCRFYSAVREERGLGGLSQCYGYYRCCEGSEQKPEPFQKQAEVVADGCEDGVDRIAAASGEVIPVASEPDSYLGFRFALRL